MVARTYLVAFGAWLVGLLALVFSEAVLVHLDDGLNWSVLQVRWHLATAVAALIPFVAYAGGAAVARLEPLRGRALGALGGVVGIVAVTGYLSTAFLVPTLRYQRAIERGEPVELTEPFGPTTPAALVQRRAYVRANPPDAYTYSIEKPLERPPNWLDFLIHRDFSWASFAVLNSFLGLLVGRALRRGGPTGRRRKLWASGLASGFALLAVMWVARNFVRSSLTVSGIAMAWLPLVVPMAAIAWLSLGPARPALAQQRPVAGEKVGV